MSGLYVPVGQSTTTPASQTQRKEVAVKAYVDDDGWVQNAGFTLKAIPELEKGPMPGLKAIVLHRTSGNTIESALASAKKRRGHAFLCGQGDCLPSCESFQEDFSCRQDQVEVL